MFCFYTLSYKFLCVILWFIYGLGIANSESNSKGINKFEHAFSYELRDGFGQNTDLSLTSISPIVPIPGSQVVTSCKAYIDLFSDIAAEFTKCSVQHARPLTICRECVSSYVKANTCYEIIMKGTVVDEAGAQCGEMLLNADRIQIIIQTSQFIDKLWEDCSCKNCYQSYGEMNETTFALLSNDTVTFLEYANETRECFLKHVINTTLPVTGQTSNSSVCVACGDVYRELNVFYSHLEDKYERHVCIDIVDAMNATRALWSRKYGCTRRIGDLWGVLLLSAIFCLLPIAFYVGNRLHGTKLRNRIVKQKRLNEVANSFHGDS